MMGASNNCLCDRYSLNKKSLGKRYMHLTNCERSCNR